MDTIGRYTIVRELGQGGMATVYLAEDPSMNRQVAIKVMALHFRDDPSLRHRFQREARLIASLDHSFIVPIYECGETEDFPFIVMRYLSGGSLAARLKQRAFTLPETVALINRLAQALDTAHRRGIIHRDLKPGNVLLDADGYAFLSDFGIAKIIQSTSLHTSTAGVIGTPEYMSPEQAIGDKALDARADVYALGVMTFQMLTGRLPFVADTPVRLIFKHINEPAPPIDTHALNLPVQLNLVLSKAMAKNPDARYASAGELAMALSTLVVPGVAPLVSAVPIGNQRESSTAPRDTHLGVLPSPTLVSSTRWWLWGMLAVLIPVMGVIAFAGAALLGGWVGSRRPTPTFAPVSTYTPTRTEMIVPSATRLAPAATATATATATDTVISYTATPMPSETATTVILTATATHRVVTARPATATPTQTFAPVATQVPPSAIPPTQPPPTAIPPTNPPPTTLPTATPWVDTPTPLPNPTATPVP